MYITNHTMDARGLSVETVDLTEFVSIEEFPNVFYEYLDDLSLWNGDFCDSVIYESGFSIDTFSASPFPPHMNLHLRGVVSYNAIFNLQNIIDNPALAHLTTHQVHVFHNGGIPIPTTPVLTLNNAWIDALVLMGSVADALRFIVLEPTLSAILEVTSGIGEALGIFDTVGGFIVHWASFHITRVSHTFGVMGSVRAGVISNPPRIDTFHTWSYFIWSPSHHVFSPNRWPDFGAQGAGNMPWGHPNFGVRIFLETFRAIPWHFSITGWN